MRQPPIARLVLASWIVLVALTAAAAGDDSIPLRNWTTPMYSLDFLGKAVDATPPRAFIGLPSCRVIDTRGGAPLGGGIFANSEARNFDVDGICGIPSGVDAISANFTVTGSPSAPPCAFILAYPTGIPPSPIVSLLNFQAGQTIANAGIVPLTAGSLTVNVSHSTHVIMDVNGYFSDQLGSPSNYFEIINNSGARTIYTANAETNCLTDCGITANIASTGGGYAITGYANGSTGPNHGVHGRSFSSSPDSAGVFGVIGAGVPGSFRAAGVRGESSLDLGVLGVAGVNGIGTIGAVKSAMGGTAAEGLLGVVLGMNYGVFANSNYGGTGAKFFVEPHPEKADMVIRYVSLEGPESGTYFRGRGKFQRGIATIEVPESFRLVTDSEGLSVQVTPIGDMASVAVASIGLDRIVVKGSRNVEFFYMVNGVRRSHKHLTPIGPGREYMPETPDAVMPEYLTEVQKEMLVSNGTYKEDGTVNMETANRLGWDKEWTKKAKE